MSPVCSTSAGRCGNSLTFATASFSVAVTSLFASLLKPMWLSLTCTKKMLLRSAGVRRSRRLSGKDFGMPPDNPQTVAVPAHAMHRRKPRRSMPSSLASAVM